MAKEYSRVERVADHLCRELAQIIQTGARDPRLEMVSITGAHLSRDFSHAQVYYTALGKDDPEAAAEVTLALNRAAGYMRARLSKGSGMRIVPKLRFHFDASVGRGRRMEELIAQATGSSGPMAEPTVEKEAE